MEKIGRPKNTESDVWKQIDIRDPDLCWEWRGTVHTKPHGQKYGRISWNDKDSRVHRLIFLFENGYLPKVVRHKCDNTLCCNPDHLQGGTHQDNMNDMKERNRAWKPKGSKHPMSKLTEDKVIDIRKLIDIGFNLKDISDCFNVSPTCIRDIKKRRRWNHI